MAVAREESGTHLEEPLMRRVVFWIVPLLVLLPALLWAQDDPKDKPKSDKPPTPAEQLKALMSEVQKAQQEIIKAYNQAKTDEEKDKAFEDYVKKPAEFTGRFLELAQKNPKDKVAFDALTYVVSNTQSDTEGDKAVGILLQNHSDKLASLFPRMVQSSSPAAGKLLRSAIEKSTDHKTQGQASLNLAEYLRNRTESPDLKEADVAKMSKEAEELLTKVAEKYADVDKLADQAKKDLEQLRTFGIGRQAPDIVGEDIDGKEFKLSDYRGKVVVIDFWGHW
jgi:hypothetical protein